MLWRIAMVTPKKVKKKVRGDSEGFCAWLDRMNRNARRFKSREEFDQHECKELLEGKELRFTESTLDTFKEFGHVIDHVVAYNGTTVKVWYQTTRGEFIRDDPGYCKRWREARIAEGVQPVEGDPRWPRD
jgi:hypothetical protein